jgi:hypothetical protein
LFDAMASLRLAVLILPTLALICLAATVYESKHGTAAAQRDVYQTGWFALLLALLGVNILFAMLKRYPWKAHHAGFVLAHIGILLLLAGSLISLRLGLDSNMALYEGESSDRVALLDKALHVALPGGAYASLPTSGFERRPPRAGREPRLALGASGATLVAEAYLPHVRLQESFEEGARPNAAVHLILDNPFAKEDAWLVARDPSRAHVHLGAASFELKTAASEAEAEGLLASNEANHLALVMLPGGRLRYGLTAREAGTTRGTATAGQAIDTPWMGMKVVVERILERAQLRRSVAAAPPPEKDERRLPALRFHLEGPEGRSDPEWIVWTESRNVAFAGRVARVSFQAPEMVVPFRVTLLKFNSDKYPGSSMAATYESWVRVDDPERGVSEHHISMNHPLHYRGYIFFQASFVEGQPMMSIFSVARAPGLPLVYAGVVLIAAGVAWMFYLKPYLARRQAARALAARRQRESAHAPSDAVPAVPAAPAQPASSGA